MRHRFGRLSFVLLGGALALSSCASPNPSGSAPSGSVAPSPGAASPGYGEVVLAPGSASAVYQPNPGAIVVAIDPGHGGCLDWGVPDPRKRGAAFAEKAMNLAIALALRQQLQDQGIVAVMTRSGDELLAGDDDPDLGCHGAPFRDVNGDGSAGFVGGSPTRAHDELQARIDLVNLARADMLVSIHINSFAQDGVTLQIAATQTFYNDETRWGASEGQRLARLVQEKVVGAISAMAGYDRQDRGAEASDYYVLMPPLYVPTAERPDPKAQPARGVLMPAVLAEVGSINLAAEQDLLLSAAGQSAIAAGLAEAIAAYLADRPLAVRYDALVDGGTAGNLTSPVPGRGPPYWLSAVPPGSLAAGLPVRLTNTGSGAWPVGLRLLVGWEASDQPYLRQAPTSLTALAVTVPALRPGESVTLLLPLPPPAGGPRSIAWITLAQGDASFADLGSPPLQLATTP
jgi:N-acetylmuramoyl-L-alanine amidase